MSEGHAPIIDRRTLAQVYIEALARVEGVELHSKFRRLREDDPLTRMLNELQQEEDEDANRLRPDSIAIACMIAQAVAAEPGLATELRRGTPVVTIATGTSDLVDQVRLVFSAIGGPRDAIVSRDGSERTHTPDRGNAEVVTALSRRQPIIGIAPSPKRQLPRLLQRMAAYRLSLPALEEWSLRTTIEYVTGKAFEDRIDQDLVRALDVGDLPLALRFDRRPAECLQRLKDVVRARLEHSNDGPFLHQLDGYGAAGDWGLRLVSDLRDFKAGRIDWNQVEGHGLLLSGPPGVGKTTFAGAVAKSAGVPIVATSVAEWNAAQHLSGTLQAMRDAFATAARSAPCILFIDEIDGISSRQTLHGDYREYWAQIVNLLLQLLDGFEERRGVVVIGATNHAEHIDPAIRRSGRLDREIGIQAPDRKALVNIFRHHIGGDIGDDVDLTPLALAAQGGTGADVEAWTRRSRAAARRAGRAMNLDDVLKEIRDGRPPMSASDRRRAAVHEAGHTVVGRLLEVGQIAAVSVHESGGATEIDYDVSGSTTRTEIENLLATVLGGRAAEELLLGNIGLGSGGSPDSDLGRATSVALTLESKAGLGSFGHVCLDVQVSDLQKYPWLLGPLKARLDAAFATARELLERNRDLLERLSLELEERGFLSADDVQAFLDGHGVSRAAKREFVH